VDDELLMRTEITPEDWSIGPSDAPVTIVEYGDFECSYCAIAYRLLHEVRATYPDRVRLVFRHFPISSLHPHAQTAAEAAEAAGVQGQFWPMHDLLFTHQQQLAPDDLRSYAQQLGLDPQRLDQELQAHIYRDKIKQHFRKGVGDGVNGTPTLFINAVRYDGPQEREALLAIVGAILAA
jgi:protein-disulfide isomerase